MTIIIPYQENVALEVAFEVFGNYVDVINRLVSRDLPYSYRYGNTPYTGGLCDPFVAQLLIILTLSESRGGKPGGNFESPGNMAILYISPFLLRF